MKTMIRNEKIEQITENILSDFNIKSIPVNAEKVIKKLNIKVKSAPSEDFSGLLLRKGKSALIGINSNEPISRQRFTVAHELGHYFMHTNKDAFVDHRDNQTGIIRNNREREANMFAAAFLMPRRHIKEDVKKILKNGIFDSEIERLAKKYKVSKEAMKYRLINLGLN